MYHFILVLSLASSSVCTASEKYGQPIADKQSIELGTALNNISFYQDRQFVMTGVVGKVCKKKGCWLTLDNGKSSIRVTFKNYGFFVPINLVGKTIKAKGNLAEVELSVAEQRHLLEDEGNLAAAKKVNRPKKTYRFVASGVEVVKKH